MSSMMTNRSRWKLEQNEKEKKNKELKKLQRFGARDVQIDIGEREEKKSRL